METEFACVKEMFIPDVAEAFQAANITALIYDPRNTGASEGLPRQEIIPQKQIQDYSDALTYLSRHPLVDPTRIAFWGFSFSGMVCLNAAALDKRAKFVIAVCPLTDFSFGGKKSKVLAKAMKDRESQALGNAPFCLPVLTEAGENPAGFGVGTASEDFGLILNAEKTAPNYRNSTTLQTYYHIAAWQPYGLIPQVSPTAVLMLTPENDQISLAKNQEAIFDSIQGAKKQRHVEPNKGHMDILSGDSFPTLMKIQVDFLTRA
ncbi:Alpha/Beta hydrolase protein [Rhexocercosporidium sp. MPI-PUGE-AT-0058]|nr:Alpha/Beta hydrolase protein [Rhexocercosporidium sp. MPI-PUGE-AT-0058]